MDMLLKIQRNHIFVLPSNSGGTTARAESRFYRATQDFCTSK